MRDELRQTLSEQGFAFVPGTAFRSLLDEEVSVSAARELAFAQSWESMPPDPYLAREGMARRRRHAVFEARGRSVRLLSPRPHFQSIDYNPLQGGFPRHLASIVPEVTGSQTLLRLIAFGSEFFASIAGSAAPWEVEAHQFRIEASGTASASPTPEGHHRDGVDFVLVVMVRRVNLERGTTSAQSDGGNELGAFTLSEPYDAALVDDRRVLHGVTPVSPSDPNNPAFRDVLVLTYRRLPQTTPPEG